MLGSMNPLVERLGRVGVQHGHGLLPNDWTAIHPSIDKMHRATGCLHAMVQSLFPRFETGKRGKQRWVDVNDPIGKGVQQTAFDDAHESSQYDQVHFGFSQGRHKGGFRFVVQFGSKLPRGNITGGNPSPTGMFQNPRILHITKNYSNFGRNNTSPYCLRYGDEVGAFAGAQNSNAK